MLGIQFVQGRPFSRDISSDTSKTLHPIIVNETLFNMLGKTAKLGTYCDPLSGTIIGVVKDYHFESLSNKIEPEEHELYYGYEKLFMFKIKAGHIPEAVKAFEKKWKTITDYPMEYSFLDEAISKMYEANNRWQKTIEYSCFFAILIACMGLFGLSAINAFNRTKEIGIRKVLGASIKDIAGTLSSGFVGMIVTSIIIATPLTYWIMTRWLEDFAYRIDIKWWMFAAAGAIAFIVALTTTSFQTIRAAVVNPVDSLRTE
jgi:putative ABC transport system permease protein